MTAVDTNVLVRIITNDDKAQAARAAAFLRDQNSVFIAKTVLLELEWVLRSVAEQPAGKVLDCLGHLIALPGVTVEDHDQIETALRHCRQGVDFADALHHAASHACTELLTFDDRRYVRRAARLGLKPPVRLLAS